VQIDSKEEAGGRGFEQTGGWSRALEESTKVGGDKKGAKEKERLASR